MKKKAEIKTETKTNTKKNTKSLALKKVSKQKKETTIGKKLVINAVVFVVLLTFCFIFASKTIEREKTIPINYTDVNKIDYKVYLKENDIYHDKYLDMNRAYVASLIDNIDIDFNYLFNIEKITKMNFDYKIIAELIIENNKGKNYVNEEYVLKDTASKKLEKSGTLNLTENVVIDYDYYNRLANKFKFETGVEINGYLNVYLQVDKETDESLNYKIKDSIKSNIKIPLSERAIEIHLDSTGGETKRQVTPVGNIKFNPIYLAIESIFFVLSCIFMINLIGYILKLIKWKTPYDKFVNKILKDYDRLIVETETNIDMSNYNIIEVDRFGELLDVRDNLKLPIVYNNTVKHEEGEFYIKNNLDIYRFIVKGKNLKK